MYTLKDIWKVILYKYTMESIYFELDVFVQLELLPNELTREGVVYLIAKKIYEYYAAEPKNVPSFISKESIAELLNRPIDEIYVSITNTVTSVAKRKHTIILSLDSNIAIDPREEIIIRNLGYMCITTTIINTT